MAAATGATASAQLAPAWTSTIGDRPEYSSYDVIERGEDQDLSYYVIGASATADSDYERRQVLLRLDDRFDEVWSLELPPPPEPTAVIEVKDLISLGGDSLKVIYLLRDASVKYGHAYTRTITLESDGPRAGPERHIQLDRAYDYDFEVISGASSRADFVIDATRRKWGALRAQEARVSSAAIGVGAGGSVKWRIEDWYYYAASSGRDQPALIDGDTTYVAIGYDKLIRFVRWNGRIARDTMILPAPDREPSDLPYSPHLVMENGTKYLTQNTGDGLEFYEIDARSTRYIGRYGSVELLNYPIAKPISFSISGNIASIIIISDYSEVVSFEIDLITGDEIGGGPTVNTSTGGLGGRTWTPTFSSNKFVDSWGGSNLTPTSTETPVRWPVIETLELSNERVYRNVVQEGDRVAIPYDYAPRKLAPLPQGGVWLGYEGTDSRLEEIALRQRGIDADGAIAYDSPVPCPPAPIYEQDFAIGPNGSPYVWSNLYDLRGGKGFALCKLTPNGEVDQSISVDEPVIPTHWPTRPFTTDTEGFTTVLVDYFSADVVELLVYDSGLNEVERFTVSNDLFVNLRAAYRIPVSGEFVVLGEVEDAYRVLRLTADGEVYETIDLPGGGSSNEYRPIVRADGSVTVLFTGYRPRAFFLYDMLPGQAGYTTRDIADVDIFDDINQFDDATGFSGHRPVKAIVGENFIGLRTNYDTTESLLRRVSTLYAIPGARSVERPRARELDLTGFPSQITDILQHEGRTYILGKTDRPTLVAYDRVLVGVGEGGASAPGRELRLSPNPVTSGATLSVTGGAAPAYLDLYDVVGRHVGRVSGAREVTPGADQRYRLPALGAGTYFAEGRDADGTPRHATVVVR